MSSNNENKECFELIRLEVANDSSFIPYRDNELDHYIAKLDKLAFFEKFYIEDALVGFIAYYCNDTVNKQAFISLVLINPKYRGRGISKELMHRTLSSIEKKGFLECSLEVNKKNKKAIKLYESTGFNIKSQTDTVRLMTKRLK